MARLREQYKKDIIPVLKEELGIKNIMAVPRLQKVVISMGTGSSVVDKKRLPEVIGDLTRIAGQKPQIRRATKAVSNFKIRRGYDVGCRVTLRGYRMYEFIDRLFNAAIPRLRDFRGLNPKSFDGGGNFSMGIPDQTIFAEIDLGSVTYNQGMNITFVTSASDDHDARVLLRLLGLPLRQPEGQDN